MPAIPTRREWRQEDQKFKIILSCRVTLMRLAWSMSLKKIKATQDEEDGSSVRDTCCQVRQLDFHPQNPHSEDRLPPAEL